MKNIFDLNAIKNIEDFMGFCHLSALEKHIVRLRNGLPHEAMTLDQIARIFDITRERVRQVENEVLNLIRRSAKFRRSRERLQDFIHSYD